MLSKVGVSGSHVTKSTPRDIWEKKPSASFSSSIANKLIKYKGLPACAAENK